MMKLAQALLDTSWMIIYISLIASLSSISVLLVIFLNEKYELVVSVVCSQSSVFGFGLG